MLLMALFMLVALFATYMVGVEKITFRQAVIGVVVSDLSILIAWLLVVALIV